LLAALALGWSQNGIAQTPDRAEQAVDPETGIQIGDGTSDTVESLGSWQIILDKVAEELAGDSITDERRALLRSQAEYVLDEALIEADRLRGDAKTMKELLTSLGPPPKKGEPAEPEAIAQKRKSLEKTLVGLETTLRQMEFAAARGKALIGEIVKDRQTRLKDELTHAGPSPLNPAVWTIAFGEFREIIALFIAAPAQWLQNEGLAGRLSRGLPVVIGAIALSVLIGWPLRLWLLRRFGRNPHVDSPSYSRRLLAALIEGIARGLLPSLALVALFVVLLSMNLLTGIFAVLVTSIATNLIIFTIVAALTHAALAPGAANWRVTGFDDESSAKASKRIITLAGFFAVANVMASPAEFISLSRETDSVFTFFFGLATGGLLLSLLQKDVWRQAKKAEVETALSEDDEAQPNRFWGNLRGLVRLLVVIAIIAGGFGYVGLTKYLLLNLILTALVAGALFLTRGFLREVAALMFRSEEDSKSAFNRLLAVNDKTQQTLLVTVNALLDLTVFVAGGIGLLSVWGVPPEDISTWLGSALRGITIGSHTFSLTDIALSIALFIALLVMTKTLQWLLKERVLPQTRLDSGVKDSVNAAVGYIGIILAFMLAVSTLGLDLSNLALVAGALSVGIGFGLQTLVNNFVSGLILLVERPIKVGDWVVVGQNEGFVKKINVRSTEITTFQHASVIIPNADIISRSVTNWTHQDPVGRTEIPVGVAYGADEEKVIELLIRCASDHPEVMAYPKPTALLMNFGPSSLDFELRAFLRKVENRRRIESDLRLAISKALRDAHIEIPFPQRVVTTKTTLADRKRFHRRATAARVRRKR
jgi:potassium efflux system protein